MASILFDKSWTELDDMPAIEEVITKDFSHLCNNKDLFTDAVWSAEEDQQTDVLEYYEYSTDTESSRDVLKNLIDEIYQSVEMKLAFYLQSVGLDMSEYLQENHA